MDCFATLAMTMRFLPFLLMFGLTGCGVIERPSGLIPRWTTAYREVITEDDRLRLRDWRTSFVAGLEAARKGAHGEEIAREGALLDPDAALPGPAIPNGMYRCCVIRLGAREPGNQDYASYPGFTCRIRPERTLQPLCKACGALRSF